VATKLEYAEKSSVPSRNSLFYLKLQWVTVKDTTERNKIGKRITLLLKEDN
jgi:hypothetical protein